VVQFLGASISRLLDEATTIEDVMSILKTLDVAQTCNRKISLSDNISYRAATIKVTAERKLGEILKATELASGAPGNQYTGKKVDRSPDATGPIRLRDLGITKTKSSRAQQIASLPEADFNKYLSECSDAGQEPTASGLVKLAKQHKVSDTIVHSAESTGLVRNLHDLIAEGRKFSTIYADPPWPYNNQATRAATNNHYPTMTLDAICAEPVAQLCEENAHLHLWTTNGFLPDVFKVMAAWGFQFKSCLIWVKPQIGIGNYWRVSHEFLLFGLRGSCPFLDHSQRSWVEHERTEHSQKPAVIRELIEKVSPGPYLELYGRTLLKNTAWTVYGNQLKSSYK
jgi:N6-adenosine-specific RNA methylase IME4